MRKKRILIGILIALFAVVTASAAPWANIAYSEGASFRIVRAGKTLSYDLLKQDVFGLEIIPGDIIHTGSGTFLEISIHPISASVQIAENTSFKCDSDQSGVQSSGELFYGRVRAKVSKLTGSNSFKIITPTLVAGVRGTDFGCDVIATRIDPSAAVQTNSSLNRVFCFEGSVIVTDSSTHDSGAGALKSEILVSAGQMLERNTLLDTAAVSPVDSLQTKSVSADVVNFWKQKPHKGYTSFVSKLSELPIQPKIRMDGVYTITDRPWPRSDDTQKTLKRDYAIPNRAAFALVGIGSILCSALAYNGINQNSPDWYLAPAYQGGVIMIGSGAVLAIISAIFD